MLFLGQEAFKALRLLEAYNFPLLVELATDKLASAYVFLYFSLHALHRFLKSQHLVAAMLGRQNALRTNIGRIAVIAIIQGDFVVHLAATFRLTALFLR